MGIIVPHSYFNDYRTWSRQLVFENQTLVVKINASHGYVQYLFLVKEHNRHMDSLQLRFSKVHGSIPNSFSRKSSHPDSLPHWRELVLMGDLRAVIGILNLGMLSGLDYLWRTCSENDEEQKKTQTILLSGVLLPNTQLLNYLCETLGHKSLLIKELCKRISLELKTRFSTIIDVWASYAPGKENEITFVVMTKKNCESPRILDRPFVHRCIDYFSSEAAHIITNENTIVSDVRGKLRTAVNMHAASLMQRHTNITLISVSSLKSKYYETGKGRLYPRPCIAIFVQVKGMIPIGEDMFPTNLDGYDTDIREGAFSPFLHEPNCEPGSIGMGVPVQGPGDNTDENGHVLGGTLGGFIDHHDFGVCCITSAHVILSPSTMFQVSQFGWKQSLLKRSICYQPCPPHEFGRVVLAVVKEGTDDSPGVEVVMIKVEDKPLHEQCTGEYRSGEIIERSELHRHMDTRNMEVIKLGAETGITKGKIHSDVTSIRLISTPVSHGKLSFTLKNQIEVLGDKFAKAGDSGAIVFHSSKNKPLKAIGMLEGGTSYNTYIVTPICEILKSLGLPPPLHMKVFDHVPMETSNSEYLEQRVEHLERTTDTIKKDVDVIKTELLKQKQKLEGQDHKLDHIIALLSARPPTQ